MKPTLAYFASFVAVAALTPACGTSSTVVCAPACASGFHCDNGSCVSDGNPVDAATADLAVQTNCSPSCGGLTPYCNDTHHCVACLSDQQCPFGSMCKVVSATVASCAPGCLGDERCHPDGGAASLSCCNLACTDTTSDPDNCGMCNKACSAPHARASCAASVCQAGTCDTGWGDCNHDVQDGCEANLHVDTANCSACGAVCALPNAVQGCSDGCYIASCRFGYADCNTNEMDGCETSVLTDTANCGGCGVPCTGRPNAAATCTAGNCVLGACNAGFFDCDGNAQNGCEVNVFTNPKNCGTCGSQCGNGLVCVNGGCTCAKCNFPNAASSCVNNMCIMGACVQGFADCNQMTVDGCESNLNSDAKNCTKCGMVCPNNTPFCANGVCGVAPPCDPNLEVNFMGHCYYLDGSGGKCDPGYALASQTILMQIAMMFTGKNYKHVPSDNCCIWNADANENWGMAMMCNAPGPFVANAVTMGGAGCSNVMNHNPMQLTLCVK